MNDVQVPVQNKSTTPAPMTPSPTAASPWEGWRPLREEMNRLFDRFTSGVGLPLARQFSDPLLVPKFASSFSLASPAVDLTEEASGYKITAELPGMTEKDIDVAVSGDVVTLKGEKRQEREDKTENYHISERSYGSFQRSFYIPEGVDRDKIAAEFSKGVLTLTLPKSAEAQKASKKIEVKPA